MPTYKTPDVYVEEISIFPPSVAEVETAIPAFIGYTEKAMVNGVEDVTKTAVEIKSLVDFKSIFGEGPPLEVEEVSLDLNNAVTESKVKSNYYMYDSIRLFFNNGGGKCYIISVGKYNGTVKKDDFIGGLEVLKKKDEPTLILFPDAVLLGDDLYDVQQQALKQCGELMDRFAILDLVESDSVSWKKGTADFRNKVGINNLKYGAAYTPYLKTNLTKTVKYKDVKDRLKKAGATISLKQLTDSKDIIATIENIDYALSDAAVINGDKTKVGSIAKFLDSKGAATLKDGYLKLIIDFKTKANIEQAKKPADQKANAVRAAFKELFKYIYSSADGLIDEWAFNKDKLLSDLGDDSRQTVMVDVRDRIKAQLKETMKKLNGYNEDADKYVGGADFSKTYKDAAFKWEAAEWGDTFTSVTADNAVYGSEGTKDAEFIVNMLKAEPAVTSVMDELSGAVAIISRAADNRVDGYEKALAATFPLFGRILDRVASSLTAMPPSGAIAGIYSMVDGMRGVWKAPANVSLNSVKDVTVLIDSKDQEELNIDTVAGKSINAIRPFVGKGVLVWGARTLAGNDNEWRYVPVRRFFNMVEESVKKSTYWAVFESNDANTWVKVRGMIENYLMQKWREGALAGATPKEAFFVKCGLGVTMTAQDILEGRMNVEIGMAVVRPAEFIILKFSHKLQTS